MSEPDNLVELHKLMGAFGAKIDALAESVRDLEVNTRRADEVASDKRSLMYQRIEALGRDVLRASDLTVRLESTLSSHVTTMNTRVTTLENFKLANERTMQRIEPAVENLGKWHQRGLGVLLAAGFLGSVFGAALDNFRAALWRMFSG